LEDRVHSTINTGPRPWAGRPLRVVLLLLALCTAACSAGTQAPKGPPVSAARITVEPGDGAAGLEPDAPVAVRVAEGRLTRVRMTDAKGRQVSGQLSGDRTSWRPSTILAPRATYTIKAEASDVKGLPATLSSRFGTVKARRLVRTAVVPLEGETVGVGQPIAVRFTTAVAEENRAAVERALTVTSSPTVTGAWHWIDGNQVRYRPRKYWPSGTRVKLGIALTGVKAGEGAYGAETRSIAFDIGPSMISKVYVDDHRMTVSRDGQQVRTIDISTGREGFETRGGTKVVLEKFAKRRMDGATIGIERNSSDYFNLDVFWTVRLTNSGEFVHAAPWSLGAQGRENISHGCVGMSDEDARWYFQNTRRGDVVDVTGNEHKPMELDNGFGDWNLSWSDWKAGSALA
jgi:lipoprotein-anchoring transpeptidase ErfK/SrfK